MACLFPLVEYEQCFTPIPNTQYTEQKENKFGKYKKNEKGKEKKKAVSRANLQIYT